MQTSRFLQYCVVRVQTGVMRLALAVRTPMARNAWHGIKGHRSLERVQTT